MTHNALQIGPPAPNTALALYRGARVLPRCLSARCEDEAVVRCLRCGKTYCSRHAFVDGYCADCEMVLSGVQARAGWSGAGIATVAGASAMFYTGLSNLLLTIVLGGCFALLAVWTTAIGRALARNRFRAGNRFSAHEMVLDGATMEIAPQMIDLNNALRGRRRVFGSSGHSAGATPTPPIWARTYGVG